MIICNVRLENLHWYFKLVSTFNQAFVCKHDIATIDANKLTELFILYSLYEMKKKLRLKYWRIWKAIGISKILGKWIYHKDYNVWRRIWCGKSVGYMTWHQQNGNSQLGSIFEMMFFNGHLVHFIASLLCYDNLSRSLHYECHNSSDVKCVF